MKNKIFLNMALLVALGCVLTAAAVTLIFQSRFSSQVKSELRTAAGVAERLMDPWADPLPFMASLPFDPSATRVTLVAPDGTVLYDNVADVAAMENHASRPEIAGAFEYGAGESVRRSESVGEDTYYYAVRLKSGYALRMAKTTQGIRSLSRDAVSWAALVCVCLTLVCLVLAARLTSGVLRPLDAYTGDARQPVYDELAPFTKAMRESMARLDEMGAAMERESALVKAISGSMREGLILLSSSGTVVSANGSAVGILRLKSDPEGRQLIEVSRDPRLLEFFRNALKTGAGSATIELEGGVYQVSITPLDSGVMMLFLDVTEKTRSERIRREFTANVSHELKTPLTSISGFAELIAGGLAKPEDVAGIASRIKSESDRLKSLVLDIMRLSELDETSSVATASRFDFSRTAALTAASLEQAAREAGVTVTTPQEPVAMVADEPMIRELLFNLIENSVKYGRKNGKVQVSARRIGQETIITVEDDGPGIAPQDQERVFERFFRVDKSRAKTIEGTGLGLSIVRHIAAAHGGSVSLDSEEGKYSVFTVRIPDARAVESGQPPVE